MEAGTKSIELEAKERTGWYVGKILNRSEGNLTKICLREEIRSLKNRNPTRWGKEMKSAWEQAGDGQMVEVLEAEQEHNTMAEAFPRILKIREDQIIQNYWAKIESSSFMPEYKKWKTKAEMEDYWGKNKISLGNKSQWARLRCGSLGLRNFEEKSYFKCRLCNKKEENLEHIWECEEARKRMDENTVEDMKEWELLNKWGTWKEILAEILKGEPVEILCKYARNYEAIIQEEKRKLDEKLYGKM